jgi:sugar phosphate isomerase/epimerase
VLQLGISSWFGYDLPLEKRLQMIVKAGFSATCLWFGEEEEMVRDGCADRIPVLVREQGLTLDNVHAAFRYCNLLWSESQKEKALFRQECSTALLFCAKHHIPNVVVHICLGTNPPPQTGGGISVIHDLVSQAEGSGVTIALENTLRPDYLEPIFSGIKSPNLGFCYDCSHDFLLGQSKGAILKKWGSLLVATHISDARGARDDHLQLGEGTIDWSTFVEAFPHNTYKGVLQLEIGKHAANLAPETFLQTAYEKTLQLAEMLDKKPL